MDYANQLGFRWGMTSNGMLINDEILKKMNDTNMVTIGRNHSQCGFVDKFFRWIIKDDHIPYNSFGNGAAIRAGCCGIVGKKY